jgi:hypothetical protein
MHKKTSIEVLSGQEQEMLVSELFLWKPASHWFGAISSFNEWAVPWKISVSQGFLLIAYVFFC